MNDNLELTGTVIAWNLALMNAGNLPTHQYKVVVVGGGTAGTTVANQLSRQVTDYC